MRKHNNILFFMPWGWRNHASCIFHWPARFIKCRVEKLELGAGIHQAVASEVGRMYSMPIPDRWYWIKESVEGEWFPAFYDKTVGWTNGDTWEDFDRQVVQWYLIPLPPSELEQKGDADD